MAIINNWPSRQAVGILDPENGVSKVIRQLILGLTVVHGGQPKSQDERSGSRILILGGEAKLGLTLGLHRDWEWAEPIVDGQ